MARLKDKQIEDIKRHVDLLRLVTSQGYQVKKHGSNDHVISCPFHDDKTPSCVISPKSNLFHCFGCGEAGSVIDWTMKTQGVSFRFACELLLNDIGAICDVNPVKHGTTTKITCDNFTNDFVVEGTDNQSNSSNSSNQALLNRVVEFYHQTLKQSPEALAYLEKRGLNSSELIEYFKLGFANRTLAYRLPDKNRKAGAHIRGQLQQVGLFRQSGHEHFNGSIVVPIIDAEANVKQIYGRKIINNLRKGTPKHLYLAAPHTCIWNEQALAISDEIILCESLIDAMTFWVNGFKNVTTSYGTEGFTVFHLAAFKKYSVNENGIKRVLIAYDRDEAGNKAAIKVANTLMNEGIDVYRLTLPLGMDINEYALQAQSADKSLAQLIRKATWLGKGQEKEKMPEQTPLLKPSEILLAETFNTETGEITLAKPVSEQATENPPQITTEPQASAQLAPAKQIEAQINDHEIIIAFSDRLYRVRGLAKNLSYAQLKINLLVKKNDAYHVDNLDLYSNKARYGFIKQAALELGVNDDVIKHDLGKVLLKLEELQEKQINACLAPQKNDISLTDDETQAALDLLKAPDLLSRILSDFDACGVIGEETNKLVGYLACVSRKLDKPLAIIIQSSSAAGKSSLMDAVLNLFPEEEKVQYSAMTGQSLFYMGETNLKHKILAIAEEEGAENASYALKLLQSEGVITIASTGKDDTTGQMVTREYRVEGPVMLFLTTTAIDIDEELMNRCLVLTVNESREQTQAIHKLQRQRRTLAGLLGKVEKTHLITLHQNAQRLLKSLAVVNPYAEQLGFQDNQTRTRRDHEKYLNLIDSIALLHQYQRPVKTIKASNEANDKEIQYIEVTLEDIKQANQLAVEVLGRTLDELPPQTRKLLTLIYDWVNGESKQQKISQADLRFSRKELREQLSWSDTALKVHLARLCEMDYLAIHLSGHKQRYFYELLYTGNNENSERFLMGLLEPKEHAINSYDANQSGQKLKQSGSGQGKVSPQSGGGQSVKACVEASKNNGCDIPVSLVAKNKVLGDKNVERHNAKHHNNIIAEQLA